MREKLVYDWLKSNNWSPFRYTIKARDKGAPDFKCSDNRWVEAKDICHEHLYLEVYQIGYWQMLIDNGYSVFLILYDTERSLVSVPLDVSQLSLKTLLSAIENMSGV